MKWLMRFIVWYFSHSRAPGFFGEAIKIDFFGEAIKIDLDKSCGISPLSYILSVCYHMDGSLY